MNSHGIASPFGVRWWIALIVLSSMAVWAQGSSALAQGGAGGKGGRGDQKVSKGQGRGGGKEQAGSAGLKGGSAGAKGGASGAGALSKLILPEEYVLGPGDQLTLSVWGEYESYDQIAISADGKASLPIIGQLKLIDLTLKQAEDLLTKEIRKYYHNVKCAISLDGLRAFKIYVLGAISQPGVYEATVDSRVSDLIGEAGGILAGGSQRHIQIKRNGDKVGLVADLVAFLRRGDQSANPYLQMGDVIFVPPTNGAVIKVTDKAASLGGSDLSDVVLPTLYEIVGNQKFSSLLYDLGGLNPAWDMRNVYIVRTKEDGQGFRKIQVDLYDLIVRKDSSKEVVLRDGDHVYFEADMRTPYLNGAGNIVGIETPYVAK